MTWEQYGGNLEGNLLDLHARLHQGAYRARLSRRVYIPKADGRQRPLGIASLEDKLVQRAVVEVLNATYEVDFLGFSYGFCPQRGPHNALDALAVGILRKKVNWLLDADIRGFFDAIDHGWLVKFVEHRIADRRILRLIQKWLSAQGRWLGQVVRGYFAYYAVPTNIKALARFRTQIIRTWHRALRRRGQRDRTSWARMGALAQRWIPPARVLHPWPDERFDVRTRGKSPVR